MKARAAITKKCILVWSIERVIQGGKIVLQLTKTDIENFCHIIK
jgi:hypothetical protein